MQMKQAQCDQAKWDKTIKPYLCIAQKQSTIDGNANIINRLV